MRLVMRLVVPLSLSIVGLIFVLIELQVTAIVPPFRFDDEDVDEPKKQAETDDAEDDPEPEQARGRITAIIWLRSRRVFAYTTVQAFSAHAVRI